MSEFASTKEAEAYDAWFRFRLERSLASTEPCVPHDHVVAELCGIIAKHKAAHASLDPARATRHLSPMNHRVVTNPEVCGGRPIVAGTRMRVSDVLDALASSVMIDELLAEGVIQLSWKGAELSKRAGPYRIGRLARS